VIGVQPDRLVGMSVVKRCLPASRLCWLASIADCRTSLSSIRGLQRDLALADPRDVEQVVDQVRQVGEHPVHARADVLGAFGRDVLAQQVQAAAQRRDGIAQFVGQHGQEAVLVAIGPAQGLGGPPVRRAGFDLLALLVEVEEHVGLAAQDVGLDRLLDEVDGPGLIASEAALASARRRSRR
jgi:hypothetical protein